MRRKFNIAAVKARPPRMPALYHGGRAYIPL